MLYYHAIFSSNSAGHVLNRNSEDGMEMETISIKTSIRINETFVHLYETEMFLGSSCRKINCCNAFLDV
jgi:hypothetical protein